jgi:hypothetical protein
MMRALIIVVAAIVVATVPARASTRRLAVVAGNNTGNAGRPPLHYADSDAAKFARVLTELGGVVPEDLFLLQNRSAAALSNTFTQVRQRIAGLRTDPEVRVVVLFYFSGHSDGIALELGSDRVTFSELRQWLASVNADVRVALIDSCKSGALLATKGGKPGPAFQIRMTDELASTGEVLLTSSAADEVALESSEIAGSFFTHHFVSGLRGAADTSGDGLVTLTEAYQYAYTRTVKTTGETLIGAQHPAYDYRLSGQGELVLAELSKRTATLELPSGFDRIVVIDAVRDQVVAEVTADTHATIAVQPGRYAIRATRGAAMFAGVVTVAQAPHAVRSADLSVMATASTTSKGPVAADAAGSLMLSAGGGTGTDVQRGFVRSLRAELVTGGGLSLSADVGSHADSSFRETYAFVFAGYRRGAVRGAWSTWAGAELGIGGAMMRSTSSTSSPYSGGIAAGGSIGISRDLWASTKIAAETTLHVGLLKGDHFAFVALPALWLGVVVQR